MSLKLSATKEELAVQFSALKTPQDISTLLDVPFERLKYHIYVSEPAARYATFSIPKKSGGQRQISAPITALKIIQRKLNQVLQAVYKPKASVHGFIYGKSIVTNAALHSKQRYILNIDLKDFFPSINFGRVRGLFMALPYNLDASVATVLAQICCFNNELPQGAPTSPIITNMICAKMDSQLRRLAQKHKCFYSRYADDITFSTSLPKFPSSIASVMSDVTMQVQVGEELSEIIKENGFEINTSKVRLQTRKSRQEVTGLTVNLFPNVERRFVRQIRAMLHAWGKYGLQAAEQVYLEKFNQNHRNSERSVPSFKDIVRGKIDFLGMVRGKNNSIYLRFCRELSLLDPEFAEIFARRPKPQQSSIAPLIITEGKTDWQHLKAAYTALKSANQLQGLEIRFYEYGDDIQMGDEELRKMCEQYSKTYQATPTVFIFDRDNDSILKKVSEIGNNYKFWGNNVFSFAIPLPSHRAATPHISIEFYYKDSEIKRADLNGRRLFFSDEFNSSSGRHLSEDMSCTDGKYRTPKVSVIDNHVYNKKHENIALPKSRFAEYILSGHLGFNDFDFTEFTKIFSVIKEIIKNH